MCLSKGQQTWDSHTYRTTIAASFTTRHITVPALGVVTQGVHTSRYTELLLVWASGVQEKLLRPLLHFKHRSYYAQNKEFDPCRIRHVSVPWTSHLSCQSLTHTTKVQQTLNPLTFSNQSTAKKTSGNQTQTRIYLATNLIINHLKPFSSKKNCSFWLLK